MADVTTAPEHFAALVGAIYGDLVDPDVVWEVAKREAPKEEGSLRRNVERASNAVGITAGSLGLSAALKDDRLAGGGKVARALHRTGRKMPSVLGRLKNPKAQAALAAGAVGTQVGNLGGDFLIAGTLGEKKPKHVVNRPAPSLGEMKQRQGQLVASHRARKDVAKAIASEARLVRKVGQGALFELPKGVRAAAGGLQEHWTKMTSGLGKAPKGVTPGPSQPTLPGLDTKTVGKPSKARSAGQNVMGAVHSTEGRTGIALGGAGALGASGLNRRRQNRAMEGGYLIGKSDAELVVKGEFTKFDDDKRQAFGWASIVTKDGMPVVDRQGDYIDIADLEEAAYVYVHKSRVGGDMHRRNGDAPHHVSDLIESFVVTPEKIAKMGLPENTPLGWWVGYQIHDEDTWAEVRKGGRTGFSIHGRGVRKDHDLDTLMGYR